MTIDGTSLEKCSKPGRWKAAPSFTAAPSNYAGFPVSSLTMYRMYYQLDQSPICKHSQEQSSQMEISYPPSTKRKLPHLNLTFVATQRKAQRCPLLPLPDCRGMLLSHSAQPEAARRCHRKHFAWEPGVKVVNVIQVLEMKKHSWKKKPFSWVVCVIFASVCQSSSCPCQVPGKKKRGSGQLCECIVALPPLVSLPFSPTGQGHASSHTQWGGLVWF